MKSVGCTASLFALREISWKAKYKIIYMMCVDLTWVSKEKIISTDLSAFMQQIYFYILNTIKLQVREWGYVCFSVAMNLKQPSLCMLKIRFERLHLVMSPVASYFCHQVVFQVSVLQRSQFGRGRDFWIMQVVDIWE